ncbi:MAG: aldose epimerase family protein [Rikenellaceae bacterium]
MSITKMTFGSLPTGEEVMKYTLQNAAGMEVHVMDYGATITSILLPNSDGIKDNIVCGFNSVEGYFSEQYLANAPFFGSTVGRYCSTIKDAKYENVTLTANCAEHNLHGGTVGFDKRMWSVVTASQSQITFALVSEDGDQGYPGRVEAEVTMTLTDANVLTFSYKATTTKRTPFTMTNHTYYNLSAFRDTVENHTIQIDSTVVIPLNSEGTFEGAKKCVAGKADDVTVPTIIGDAHKQMGEGFEHYYFYACGLQNTPRKIGEFAYPAMNRKVEFSTTEHGGLFYTGKYTSDELRRESGEQFGKHRGLCIETHRIPNGPNLTGAPDIMLEAGETFKSETSFKFSF